MMSRTRGMLCSATGSAVSREAAIAGSEEFFAPLIATVPCRAFPPLIRNLSIASRCPRFVQRRSQISLCCHQQFLCLARIHAALQHHWTQAHIVSRLTQCVFRRGHTCSRRFLQNSHRAPFQLLICSLHINPQVFIRISQLHHRGGTQHVQDHLLRRSRLQSRRTRKHFRAHLSPDKYVRVLF